MSSKANATPVQPDARPIASNLFAREDSQRHREILDAAAVLFAERGYPATSVRDIGERVGLLGGSLYHYIKSKEALFTRIHDTALQTAADLIQEALIPFKDPWERLEAACIKMLEIQLDPNSITLPLMNNLQAVPSDVRVRLIAKRDEFEKIFVKLIAELPLDPELDRSIYRLLLLTLLNNVSTWYRGGRLTPKDIGHQIMLIFRHHAGAVSPQNHHRQKLGGVSRAKKDTRR